MFFENDSSSSVTRSLLGALIALGAGFAFMLAGFIAVLNFSFESESLRDARALDKALRQDLYGFKSESLRISSDGSRLTFLTVKDDVAASVVVYQIDSRLGRVVRSTGDGSKVIAKLDKPVFIKQDILLQLSWKEPGGKASMSWALERFPCR